VADCEALCTHIKKWEGLTTNGAALTPEHPCVQFWLTAKERLALARTTIDGDDAAASFGDEDYYIDSDVEGDE
jgi:hypothetical protein